MKRILLVDDEQNVLNALRRELKDHFEIDTFDNPAQALERCRETPFDLVIADYKMPEMNGLEFLKQFGSIQPDAARLVLSGEADIDALIRTINETHIYRFLAKPWEKAELLSSIRQALIYRDSILENRRQADAYRDSHAALRTTEDTTPYRIVLVENDEHLLALMSRSLCDESGRENLYVAMQQEIKPSVPAKKFKCVVEAFRTAQAALTYAEKAHCDLVIAAQKLPDMDGTQLLSNMRQVLPDAARILLSSDPDKAMLSRAINEAEVQNLLQLHWSSYDLRTDVRRQAWNLYQLKTAAIQALASRDMLLENRRLAGLN
ncbi:MAG: response regulator [Gallionella sp.]